MGMQSCLKDALPFAGMVMVECGEIGMVTLSKAAMNTGMSNFVFVVYYNALGTFILLPYYIFHTYRFKRPPLTFSLLCRFFLLGLLGICLVQIFAFMGINYSSPTLAAALGNLVPAFTFLLAIISRMEKLDLQRSSSQAKALGTMVAISGAFMITLYKGPPILMGASPSNSPHPLLLSQQSNWVLGGLLIAMTCFASSIWIIFLVNSTHKNKNKKTKMLDESITCACIPIDNYTPLADYTCGTSHIIK
uniref:WAT1-related protein n=1 Tax=Davidia involucrata TaxID=16924 RepID=A0A5B7BH56_DAVIN